MLRKSAKECLCVRRRKDKRCARSQSAAARDRTLALAMKLVPVNFCHAVFSLIACILACSTPARCDPSTEAPCFWDPRARPAKLDLANLHNLRFLTEDDYPPFHFTTPDGALTGFDVDLARAICDDLKLSCTIQARRFDTLINSLDADQGDAIIAAIQNRPKIPRHAGFHCALF